MKVYEVDVPITVNTIATVIAESESDAIRIMRERLSDRDEFAEYLHGSVHWFTDDRFVNVHKQGDWWCYESEMLRWDEKLNDAVPTEEFKNHIVKKEDDDDE